MDFCRFIPCCTETGMSKKKALRCGSPSNNCPVRIQPGPVGNMKVYEELDESYGPRVEKDYSQIQKAMETAPRDVVQRALGMEPKTLESAEAKRKSITLQQPDALERRLRKAGSEEAGPVKNSDRDSGHAQTDCNFDPHGGDHDDSDPDTGAVYSKRAGDSEETSDGESAAEIGTAVIGTAVQVSVKQVQADNTASTLESPESPEDEEPYVISGDKDGDSDSDSVSSSGSEYSVDNILVDSQIGNEQNVARSAECRELPEKIPEVSQKDN